MAAASESKISAGVDAFPTPTAESASVLHENSSSLLLRVVWWLSFVTDK